MLSCFNVLVCVCLICLILRFRFGGFDALFCVGLVCVVGALFACFVVCWLVLCC